MRHFSIVYYSFWRSSPSCCSIAFLKNPDDHGVQQEACPPGPPPVAHEGWRHPTEVDDVRGMNSTPEQKGGFFFPCQTGVWRAHMIRTNMARGMGHALVFYPTTWMPRKRRCETNDPVGPYGMRREIACVVAQSHGCILESRCHYVGLNSG